MSKVIAVNDGVIRPGLIAELESFRAPRQRVSTYYLNLRSPRLPGNVAARIALKNRLAEAREQVDQQDVRPSVHNALRRDCDLVAEIAPRLIGERHTYALACFMASVAGTGRIIRLPWPVREHVFFDDRFVVWPLRQLLRQSDRYAICLTDKDEARLFLSQMEQVEEVADVVDKIPGRVRFPDPYGEFGYMHKHSEHFHHHFDKVAQRVLRLFEQESFNHLIIGGLWATLAQFEDHLHQYLRERVIARWDITVRTPAPEILGRAIHEEEQLMCRQAQDIWTAIQEQRPHRGALGRDAVFALLWQRRAEAVLVQPGKSQPGFRCAVCGRLHTGRGPCVECGGKTAAVPDVYEEAVHQAVEQSARVRYWDAPPLSDVDSISALSRF